MSLVARLAGVAAVVLVALSIGASPSHALVEEAYLAAAQEDALWYRVSVTGTAWPDTFPASWAAPSAHKVSVAAKTLPALRVVGTLWLGATAFEVGWKIGRTIDTKWLHLSGDIGVDTTAAGNVRWMFGQWCGVCPVDSWHLVMNTAQGSLEFCDACPTRDQAGWDQQQAVLDAGVGQELILSPSSCGITSGVCRIVHVPEAEMEASVIQSVPEPYTTQPFDITTNIPAPVKNATNLEAARNTVTELGEAVQNEYNASLETYDPDLRAAIAQSPYTINDFRYVSSQRLFDDDGREFELHFFQNTVTGKAVLSRGFKIRWVHLFEPS